MRREKLQEKCRTRTAKPVLCESAQTKWTCHMRHFTQTFCKESGRGHTSGVTFLREHAQSKCTWTFHNSRLSCGNLQGKCWMRLPRQLFCASLDISQAHARAILLGKLQGRCRTLDTMLIEHRALTSTARTPHCGHAVWRRLQAEVVETTLSCETSFKTAS